VVTKGIVTDKTLMTT